MITARCLLAAAVVLSVEGIAVAGQPVELASGAQPQHPQQPQVAVDAAGGIHVVFGSGDTIHYCRSANSGKSFGKPATVATVSNMSLGMRRGPRVAVGGGFVCVTAIGGKQGKGRDGDILAFRSSDGGQTWQGPSTVNDVTDAAREGLHAMAGGPTGELCCVWLDLRKDGTKIYASTSRDGGVSWAKNYLVYESPDGRVCECCHPSVTFDSTGGLYVMWRNALAGNRDLYVCKSGDGGQSFGPAAKLGEGTWLLKACPMDGGAVAALGPDRLATVWRRDKSVYLTMPGSSTEKLLGTGEQPWITATAAGPFVTWLNKRNEALFVLSPEEKSPRELAAHAFDPVIASNLTGRGPVVAAWETRDGNRRSILAQVISE